MPRQTQNIWDQDSDIIILDNRDSFVYNIAHRLFEVGASSRVLRSDKIDLQELIDLRPRALIISPGPGHPKDAGISVEAIRYFSSKIPILGICLGHQAIAAAFGGNVARGEKPRHGKLSSIEFDSDDPIFAGLKNPEVGRYHSLIVERPLIDPLVEIASSTDDGFVMGIRVRDEPIWGVQFHPESVLTKEGSKIFSNFVKLLDGE